MTGLAPELRVVVVVIVAVSVVYAVKMCGTKVSVTSWEPAVPVTMVAKEGRGIGAAAAALPPIVVADAKFWHCTDGKKDATSAAVAKRHIMNDAAIGLCKCRKTWSIQENVKLHKEKGVTMLQMCL